MNSILTPAMGLETSTPTRTVAPASKWLLAAGAALLIAGSMLLDQPVREWVAPGADPSWTARARSISHAGNLLQLLLLSAGGWLVGGMLGWKRARRIVPVMMLAGILTGVVAATIRGATGRTRPCAADAPQGWYGVRHDGRWLPGVHDFNSFPSGHTSAATALFAVVCLRHRRVGLIALVPPLLIGWSRIYLNRHHFSDVVAGLLLGLAGAWWTTGWVWPRSERRWSRRSVKVPSAMGEALERPSDAVAA